MPAPFQVTQLLHSARQGNEQAIAEIWPLVYEELRALARRQLGRESANPMLQATALVHEAFLKLAGNAATAENRAHFVAIAARAMRQVLIDEARRRQAQKRGGGQVHTTLCEGVDAVAVNTEELLLLDGALDKLEPRQREIIELRFFGGLSELEVAELLGISDRTVRREWVKARAWLYRELYPAQ